MLLENELNVLRKLKSKYIISMKAIYQTINNTYIISEFCNQGNIA